MLSKFYNRNIIFIDTQTKLQRYLNDIYSLHYLGLDTETTGLCPFRNKLLLIQIGTLDVQYIIDARKVNPEPLKVLLENTKIPKYGANLVFDYKFFKRKGIEVECNRDIMIADILLNVGKIQLAKKGNYTMEAIMERRIGVKMNKNIRMSFIGHTGEFSQEQIEYAADDIIAPILIYKKQHKELISEGLLNTAKLEFECIPVFGDIEYNGMYLNKDKWKNLIETNIKKYWEYRKKVQQLFLPIWDANLLGELNMKLNSDEHILYGLRRLGYNIENTTEETLQLGCPEDIYKPITSFREYDTILSRYGENWFDAINPVTNRVHTNLFQIGTECCDRNSIIPSSLGLVNIDDFGKLADKKWIDLNITVASKDGNDQTSHVYNGGLREVIKIKTVGGHEITATPEHPLWSLKWEKDYYPHQYDFDKADWHTISVLNKNSYIATSIGNNVWGSNKLKLELAELLGMWFANGSIHDSNGSWKIRIASNSSTAQTRVQHLVKLLFNLKAEVRVDQKGNNYIEFGNIKLKWIEKEFDLKRGTINKKIPVQIKTGTQAVIEAFIKGAHLDSSRRRGNILHHVRTKEVAQWFHAAYLNLGYETILSRFYDKRRDAHYYKLEIKSERKKGIIFRKIKSIEVQKEQQFVYDLTVPKSHSFIANGIVSHNTGRPSSRSPNLLNVKRENDYRNCFEAQNKGGMIVSADFEGQEMRIITELTKEPTFIKAFNEGKNVHKIVGSEIFGVEVGKGEHLISFGDNINIKQIDLYNITKNLSFGKAYGAGPAKIMALMRKVGVPCDMNRAKSIVNDYNYRYHTLNDKLRQISENTIVNGYSKSLGGRKRYFKIPDIKELGYKEYIRYKSGIERAGANHCVDFETTCLTKTGWKNGHDLIVGEEILSKNPNTGLLEWQPVKYITILEDKEVEEFSHRDFSAVSTNKHRWLIDKRIGRNKDYVITETTTENLIAGEHKIHRTGKYFQRENRYWRDVELRILGWVLTNGGYKHKQCYISQSKPEAVSKISHLLDGLPHRKISKRLRQGVNYECFNWIFDPKFYLNEKIQNIFPDKSLNLQFIFSLSQRQAKILVQEMLLGDGSGENVFYAGNNINRAELFQILVYVSGHHSTIRKCDEREHIIGTQIFKSQKNYIVHISSRHRTQVLKEQRKLIGKKDVWCPTISNGFFVAKRHGHIYITGNCVQGTGADMLKKSLVILRKRIKREKIQNNIKIILPPYDEIDCESEPNTDHEYHKLIVEESMIAGQEFYQNDVPAGVEGTLASCWTK